MTWIARTLLLGVIITGLALPAAAQQSTTVTQADIQRLQDNVYLADRDVSQARSRDAARATQLQTELDDLRDEVVYLKVKLRKERTLARSEYADVRDRIEDLRSRARGDSTSAAPRCLVIGRSCRCAICAVTAHDPLHRVRCRRLRRRPLRLVRARRARRLERWRFRSVRRSMCVCRPR